jgi:MFS family permease
VRTIPRTSFKAALANSEFRALWFAETQSMLGDQLTIVALSLLVYHRTGSALWSAVVYSLTFLPALAGGLGLSHLADRYPRRTILTICAGLQAVLVATMAIPHLPLVALCVLVVVVRLIGAPANAAQNALTREVFTQDEVYLRSQDLRGITTNTAMLLGLAGGGLLVTGLGTSWALILDAITFAISALIVRFCLVHRPAAGAADAKWFGSIRWVFTQGNLRVLIGLSWLVGFAVIPEGLAAPLAREIGAQDGAIGWLLAADPLGFVIGAFLLSRYVSSRTRLRILGVLAIAPLAILMGFAVKPTLALALLLLAAAGATGAYVITVTATFLTWVPNELRGGAGGLYRTGLRVVQGVGVALGGVAAQLFDSATTAITVAGAVGTAVGIPIAISWSQINSTHRNASSSHGS